MTLVERLRAAGCVFAEDEARLLEAAAGTPQELAALAERRVAGEPLEQVIGWAEFCGHRIALAPGVFVPRPRTAWLVRTAAALAPATPVTVDLCTGSGAVAVALAGLSRPRELHAADLDPAAVDCARRNLAGLGEVHHGDLFDALPRRLRGAVDLLTVNAPYVPTGAIGLMPREARDYEPRNALDGGPDGLAVHRRVLADARDWLAPGGVLVFEVAAAQAGVAVGAAGRAGLRAEIRTSDDPDATVISAAAPSSQAGRRPHAPGR